MTNGIQGDCSDAGHDARGTAVPQGPARVDVREVLPGDGTAVAALYRELGATYDTWGGYPFSKDLAVYAELARQLDAGARVRAYGGVPEPRLRLVAETGGVVCGQVEGLVERHGILPETPFTCSFRSLVVARCVRGSGAGRKLLEGLERAARSLTYGAPCVLSGEVLESNPALSFYDRLGYAPIAYVARLSADGGAAAGGGRRAATTARQALPEDALTVARLDVVLAGRRRAAGDPRFDPPHAIDPGRVAGIAARFASDALHAAPNPVTLVSVDGNGVIVGAALFEVQQLDSPLVPARRGLLQCFAFDSTRDPLSIVGSVVTLACKLALAQGASHVEVTDLLAPGTTLHAAVVAAGAVPWSRLVARLAWTDR